MQLAEKKLYRYGELQRLIKEREQELIDLFAQKQSFLEGLLRAPACDNVRVMGGQTSDPTYSAVERMGELYDARIISKQTYIAELWGEFDELQRMVDRAGLTDQERKYMRLRYVLNTAVNMIPGLLGYSESRTREIKTSVLSAFSGVLSAESGETPAVIGGN